MQGGDVTGGEDGSPHLRGPHAAAQPIRAWADLLA